LTFMHVTIPTVWMYLFEWISDYRILKTMSAPGILKIMQVFQYILKHVH